METQQTEKRPRGRATKYDFTTLVNVGDTIEFEPHGKSFTKRNVRNITSALVQYRRKYKPSNMYTTRSIQDDNGKVSKVIVILINIQAQ
jgi:tRNA U38,U39,U40 pseudouridine synthase TruA